MSSSGLRRELGLRDLVLFNIAAVVGIRWLAAAAHTGSGSLVLWGLAAFFFFIPSAIAVSELSARFPDEGGIYAWTKRGFGPWHGFLCGWCYWLSNLFYFPNLLLAGIGMAAYAAGAGENRTLIVGGSLAVLWLVLVTNLIGLSFGKWTGNLGAIATYAAGVAVMGLGVAVWMARGSATPIHASLSWDWNKLNFWPQIAFAFSGLELGAILSGEIRNPERTVPRAVWISSGAIALFYIAGTLAMLAALPAEQISAFTGLVEVAHAAGQVLKAGWVLPVMAGLIGLGVAGQMSAWVGGSARIPFAIGLDRYLPPAFARLHPRWGTPHIAILCQGLVCTVFLLVLQAGENIKGIYQLLVDMTVITYFIPFVYMFAAAWRYGRRSSAASGLGVTVLALALSLVPPPEAASAMLFEAKILGGCFVIVAAARLSFWYGSRQAERVR